MKDFSPEKKEYRSPAMRIIGFQSPINLLGASDTPPYGTIPVIIISRKNP
jgi:hypothetical protein